MDKEILNSVKEKIYEIEGLLELMSLRPEKQAELQSMVAARLEAVATLFAGTENDVECCPENEGDDVKLELMGSPDNIDLPEDAELPEADDLPETDDIVEEEELPEEDEEFYCLPDDEEDESEMEISDSQTEAVDNISSATAPLSPPSPLAPPSPSRRIIPKPIFCLNDRFRYCKSLFGGSSADFNSMIERISMMGSSEEAERYFYEEKGMNPEDPEVMSFMEIVVNSFK